MVTSKKTQLDNAKKKKRGIISLTLRTRNLKKSSRMLARNWKRQWPLPCLARQARTVRKERSVVNPTRSNQNLRVLQKQVNLQDCVWANLNRAIMNTIYCRKRKQFTKALQIGSQVYSYASSNENSSSKGSGG